MTAHPTLYSPYDAGLWDSIRDGAMALQQCTGCGTFRYPPGAACPGCLSTDFAWTPLSGEAAALSWTTFHRQYLPAYPAPHTVVAAQLAEGPILIAGMDEAEREDLTLGAALKIAVREHPDGYKVPWFTLADGA